MSNIIEQLTRNYPANNFIYLVGLDSAIIGVDQRESEESAVLVYSVKKIIANFVNTGMDYDEALEYFYYNVEGAYFGENTPLIVCDLNLEIDQEPVIAKDIVITFRAN